MKISRVALVVPAVLLVAACGAAATGNDKPAAGDSSISGKVLSDPAPVAAPEPTAADGDQLSATSYDAANGAAATVPRGGLAPDSGKAVSTEPATQSVISKGQVSLRSKNLDKARFNLQKLLDQLDGTIANEQSSADKSGHTDLQRLELRVPSKRFDEAMDKISGLGTLVDRSRSSKDVSTEVIDNNARIRSQKLSLARVQALLAQATTLNQVISIESQLARRQADLESLEQQQKFLADQTAMSTINVYLEVPGKKAATRSDDNGFFSGLHDGWNQLGSSTAAVLTGIGAVLPFGILLALVGVPAWAAWRRRTAGRPVAATPVEA